MAHEKAELMVLAPVLVQLAVLARDPNITRAAARTGSTQPTLSRALRHWERELGFPLLEKDGRSVRLTAQARMLAAAAADALALLDDTLERLQGRTVAPSVTIGFLRSLGPTVVAELVGSFLRGAPGVRVGHREGPSADLIDGLDDGTIDVALTTPRPPEAYEWLPVGRQHFALVLPAGHSRAGAESLQLREFRDEPFLALDRRFDARRRADALCESAGFTPNVILQADDVATLRTYVGTGLGVALLPADTATDARTSSVRIDAPDAHREFGLVWRADRLTATGRALLDHARTLSSQYPGWADIDT